MKNKTPSFLNRRELLLLGVATPTLVLLPTFSFATIPPPPISIWYLLFIADGIYKISNFYTVTLPASAGTCQNYTRPASVDAIRRQLHLHRPMGLRPWNMLAGRRRRKWWEVYDKRIGRYVRIWEVRSD